MSGSKRSAQKGSQQGIGIGRAESKNASDHIVRPSAIHLPEDACREPYILSSVAPLRLSRNAAVTRYGITKSTIRSNGPPIASRTRWSSDKPRAASWETALACFLTRKS